MHSSTFGHNIIAKHNGIKLEGGAKAWEKPKREVTEKAWEKSKGEVTGKAWER